MGGFERAVRIFAVVLILDMARWATPAVAQTLESAIHQFEAGEIKTAVLDWESLARGGDADALFNLGQVFRLGAGEAADMPRAASYYRRAAELGHTPAMRELGRLFAFDPAFAPQRGEGVDLLRTAAHAGDPVAQYLLGAILLAGDLAPREKIRAYAWTQLAAEGGEGQAVALRLALQGELSDGKIAEAFSLSRTLITAPYRAASYTLLVGERPVPRRFAEAVTGPAPAPEEKTSEPADEEAVMAEAPDVKAPPLDLPEPEPKPAREALAEIVGEAEAMMTGMEGEEAEAIEAGEPMAAGEEEPDSTPPPEEHAADTGDVPVREEETAAPELPALAEELGPAVSDLGDPGSPLVDAEGFAGAFSIQLASFRTPEKAEEEWQALTREAAELFSGLEKRILRFELGPELGVRYRLRIGPFADKDAADARCQKLTEAGIGCLVIWP